MMNLIRTIRGDGGAGAVAGGVKLDRRLPHLGRRILRQSSPATRPTRVVAGTLFGLGVVLFPGLALLALQVCLVLAWAYLMLSLVVSGLR